VIGDKPAVKIQSTSPAPGIGTAPPSVGQVPMPDDVPTGSATVSRSTNMFKVYSDIFRVYPSGSSMASQKSSDI
jgi:hypothetical protein